MHLLILSRYSPLGASSRLRMMHYLPALQGAGIDVEVSPLLDDAYVRDLLPGWSRCPRPRVPTGSTCVGDMAGILESERVGVALEGFEPDSLQQCLKRLITLTREPDFQTSCVAAAQRHFSLEEGVARYQAVYRALEATT